MRATYTFIENWTTGESCGAIVDDATANDVFLVRGSRRVVHECKSHASMQDVPGVDISARECVVYELVARHDATHSTGQVAVFVAPEKRGWRVLLQETSRTGDSRTPSPEWAHRIPPTT